MEIILRSNPILAHSPNIEILVLDDKGTNLGRMLYRDAKLLADNRNLDLVQVNKDDTFKIMDHGKYKYDKKKNKQKKVVQPLKEMTFKMRIDPHDLGIKINRIKKFLLKGSDVRILVVMRGREKASPHLAQEKLDLILKELDGLVLVQQQKAAIASIFVTVRPLKRNNNERSDKRRPNESDNRPNESVK